MNIDIGIGKEAAHGNHDGNQGSGHSPEEGTQGLRLSPGAGVDLMSAHKARSCARLATGLRPSQRDRIESARGKAQTPWRTDDLMGLLRGTD
ncbi:MAG: AbrB family transcriptional regulator [Candidatus Accumulibacter sp.]|nr:AbrB family transcriptional regulator [Accumulibacter sp.]